MTLHDTSLLGAPYTGRALRRTRIMETQANGITIDFWWIPAGQINTLSAHTNFNTFGKGWAPFWVGDNSPYTWRPRSSTIVRESEERDI